MRFPNVLLSIAVCAMPSLAQDPTYTNSIGMQFVLIKPGSVRIGVYQPTCPDPNRQNAARAGGGGQPGANAAQGPGQGAGGDAAVGARGGAARGGGGQAGANAAQGPGQGAGGDAAAGARGGAARGGGARGPADPRTLWTAADYAKCQELVKQDAMPGFIVDIKKAYYIGTYEVTQGQWKKVMGSNPSVFQGSRVTDDADKHPVDNVKWQDTQVFLKKLNALEKTTVYRLPSEFEWEYAGRAGETGSTPWAEIREVAVEQMGPRGNTASTAVVGTKKPNPWGLYDMLGNVWEWVQDPYNDKIFADPVPPKKGTEHVLKGGGFLADVKNTIYATHGAGPGAGYDVGFRIVRDVK